MDFVLEKMSASQDDKIFRNYNKKSLLNQMRSQNSLFSEIMKNHNSGQNTPTVLTDNKNTEIIPFNVKDVPLPSTNSKKSSKINFEKSIKSEKALKRNHDDDADDKERKRIKKQHCEQKIKHSSSNIIDKKLIKPKMCERRTNNHRGSTWGGRSVGAFQILSEVGEGTYGHVFKARDRVTGTIKALKKVRLENEREGFPITTVREIKILQQLSHPNIVRLHEVVTDYELGDDNSNNRKDGDRGFYLVFEYLDYDLYGIIDSGIHLSELQIASIMKQILEGISYSHRKMFLHRDIKCSNILINNRGEVKIADYGLSRRYYSDHIKRPYTNKVITLWYRAPELLLGEECYGTSIDMWSIGCIMGELFTHKAMFTANSEMDQLDAISRVCGTPSPAMWPDITKLPLYKTYRPKYSNRRRLKEHYFTVPSNALDVLDWLLQLDPKRRCSADQAIRSYWLCKIDPRKIEPPQFPTDGDYHELSCKRRHKILDPSADTGYKSSNTLKEVQQRSSSSSCDLRASIPPPPLHTAPPPQPTFQLPDDMLSVLNQQLLNIIPDTSIIIKKLLESSSHVLSDNNNNNNNNNNNINAELERILEPYIREILRSSNIKENSNNNNSRSSRSIE